METPPNVEKPSTSFPLSTESIMQSLTNHFQQQTVSGNNNQVNFSNNQIFNHIFVYGSPFIQTKQDNIY